MSKSDRQPSSQPGEVHLAGETVGRSAAGDWSASRPRAGGLPRPTNLFWVMLGGMAGAGLRLGLSSIWLRPEGGLPWATLVENVTGALALGFLLTVLVERTRPRRPTQLLLCTGLLGSFTTFSAMSYEGVQLMEERGLLWALGYLLVSVMAGLVAAVIGIMLARKPGRRRPGG